VYITVEFPLEANYSGTTTWFLDPRDEWTVGQLLANVVDESGLVDPETCKLQRNGVDLGNAGSMHAALDDGDTISLVAV